MAGKGPRPKPAHLRQRTNRKPGAATLQRPSTGLTRRPALPNVDGREWQPLTRAWWRRVWRSPMAGEYLDVDVDGLGRLAILVDAYYQKPTPALLAEVRLQEARFGLSPADRARLQWEVSRGRDAERKRRSLPPATKPAADPRTLLMAVK